ncbi:phage head closure protein [Clostridium niameyense]|uniref:phage head closure protein n=1 Tax=Clostridium niameyense TaxID=1622073 RepID=UPI001969ACB1
MDDYDIPTGKEEPNIFRECSASVRSLRGREFYAAAQTQNEDNKVFNCRYFKGLLPSMQIEYKDKIYDIISINDLYERHTEYEIRAKEVTVGG